MLGTAIIQHIGLFKNYYCRVEDIDVFGYFVRLIVNGSTIRPIIHGHLETRI